MIIENEKSDGYITLKEASEHFGYAPDYIGQLIRKGKIEGKQVFANVAWVTTHEAMEEYILREKGKSKSTTITEKTEPLFDRLMAGIFVGTRSVYVRYALRALLVLLGFCAVFAFYLLSVALDHYLTEKAAEDLRERNNKTTNIAPTQHLAVSHSTHGVR